MGATTTTTTTTTVAKSAYADGAKQSGTMLLNGHSFDVTVDDMDNNNVSDNNHNNQRNGGDVVGGGVDIITAAIGAASNIDPPATATEAADTETNTKSGHADDEYVYFGFKVGAKLKWTNIIGIIIIHMMFVYTFMHNPFLPSIYTYAWGKPTNYN